MLKSALGQGRKIRSRIASKASQISRGECKWREVRDVTAKSFCTWRDKEAERKSAKTLNEYLHAINGLMNWLQPRVGINPLRFVQKAELNGKNKREGRAFTAEELERLCSVSGRRGFVYRIAARTGIRRGELNEIEQRDIHLEAPLPFIVVRASISKNHKQAMQPLTPDAVYALRELTHGDERPTDRVFKGLIPRMPRFRADLEAAGISYIDTKGEYADFHSLGKTFGTMLTLAGVPQRVVMELMRHSDMRLTALVYTDAGMLPIDDAISKLPMLTAESAAPQIAPQTFVPARPELSADVPALGIVGEL